MARNKDIPLFIRKIGFALLLSAFLSMVLPSMVSAVTTKRVWSSPITGYAIDGYDPVAYFTDAAPRKGLVEYEYIWSGVAWHFVNEGNLEAFKSNPEIYAPQFGGYALGGIYNKVLLPPNPLQWALYQKKLYLFNTAKAKKKFEKNIKGNLSVAAKNWEILLETINE